MGCCRLSEPLSRRGSEVISDSVVHEHKMLSERGESARGVETSGKVLVIRGGCGLRIRVILMGLDSLSRITGCGRECVDCERKCVAG